MKLGQEVTVTAIYNRRTKEGSEVIKKIWEKKSSQPTKAVWIGWRTLSNGTCTYDSYDGYVYIPEKFFRAELVVFDPRRKPVLCEIKKEEKE